MNKSNIMPQRNGLGSATFVNGLDTVFERILVAMTREIQVCAGSVRGTGGAPEGFTNGHVRFLAEHLFDEDYLQLK